MKIAVFEGDFDPPHRGHTEAAGAVAEELEPDRLRIVPRPLSRERRENCPSDEERLSLCRLAFGQLPGAEVSDMALRREGESRLCDTVAALREEFPADELILIVGTDVLLRLEEQERFRYLLEQCTLAAVARTEDDDDLIRTHACLLREKYGARVVPVAHTPVPVSAAELRQRLPLRLGADELPEAVYEQIIRLRLYGARPELPWLRGRIEEHLDPGRIAHVAGCDSEAVMLALRWGEDADTASEAAILHDITKRLSPQEQLRLCEKYGIMNSNSELAHPKLLHAKTGAALARELFGVEEAVCAAIRYHTTGKPDMTLLEKILYLADYIEPTRDFPGVEALRELAYEDIDRAMALGLQMSIEEIRSRGEEPFEDTINACRRYQAGTE